MGTVAELEGALENETVQAYMTTLDIDTTNAWLLFKLLDVEARGFVDLGQFVTGCLKLRGNAKTIHIAQISADNQSLRRTLELFMSCTMKQLKILTASRTPSNKY